MIAKLAPAEDEIEGTICTNSNATQLKSILVISQPLYMPPWLVFVFKLVNVFLVWL